ncbi:MAG: ABC transporter substrate-binding protein [Deltaproteobacteria bacterium]|jgi:branched-chain amino acid transport system substrate-binding protein|nr:ABC transporter substrate-binding protein [Deltaproteobacteria bacterium]
MFKNKKFVLGTIAVVLLVIVTVLVVNRKNQTNTNKDKDVIKIGAILPLTGPASFAGELTKRGIDIAIKHQNNNGINGRKILVIYEDSVNQAKEGVAAYNKLSENDNIDIFVSIYSVPTVAILSSALVKEKNGGLFVTSHIAKTDITTLYPKIFNVAQSTQQEAETLAKFFYNSKHMKRVVTYSVDDDFGKDFVRYFIENFTALGGTVVKSGNYKGENPDHRQQLTILKSFNSDFCLFAGADQRIAKAIRQGREIGLNVPYAVSSTISTTELKNMLPQDISSVYYVAPECNVKDNSKDLLDTNSILIVNDYRNTYKAELDFASGFPCAAMQFLFEGIKQSKTLSTEDIFTSLAQIKELNTVVGKVEFDNRTRTAKFKLVVMNMLDNKKSELVWE